MKSKKGLTLIQLLVVVIILGALVANDVPVEKFEIALPTLAEIFIRVVKEEAQ